MYNVEVMSTYLSACFILETTRQISMKYGIGV